MLGLTKQEQAIVLFLLTTFLVGVGVSLYRNNFLPAAVSSEDDLKKQNDFLASFLEKSKIDEKKVASDDQLKVVAASGKKIDLNSATFEDLMELPRIGPVMARRIIEWRQIEGKFSCPEDLKKVKGIGTKTYEKLSPFIIVN